MTTVDTRAVLRRIAPAMLGDAAELVDIDSVLDDALAGRSARQADRQHVLGFGGVDGTELLAQLAQFATAVQTTMAFVRAVEAAKEPGLTRPTLIERWRNALLAAGVAVVAVDEAVRLGADDLSALLGILR